MLNRIPGTGDSGERNRQGCFFSGNVYFDVGWQTINKKILEIKIFQVVLSTIKI